MKRGHRQPERATDQGCGFKSCRARQHLRGCRLALCRDVSGNFRDVAPGSRYGLGGAVPGQRSADRVGRETGRPELRQRWTGVNPMRGKLEEIRDVTESLWLWR